MEFIGAYPVSESVRVKQNIVKLNIPLKIRRIELPRHVILRIVISYSLLAMIAFLTVESCTPKLIHNAILFTYTSSNA